MAIKIRDSEIERLGRFYRDAIHDIAREFVSNIDFATSREATHIHVVLLLLKDLERKSERWAKRNIVKLYKSASKEAGKRFRKAGLSRKQVNINAYAVVNDKAIQALLTDPQVGFLTGINGGIQQIKNRMSFIQNQAKLLRTSQRLFSTTIAKVGLLQGKAVNEVRDRLVDEMVKLKKSSELAFTKKALNLPPGHIIKAVAELPFVKIPTSTAAKGFRNLRIDMYAELLARTKTGQAASLARRHKAMEHGIPLVQITKNKPLQDDACFLYIGRVFALTEAGKNQWGVPLVDELPNGGAPFHPNCTHSELIFIPKSKSKEEIGIITTSPPKWALNRPYSEVQKEYDRRGGAANIEEFNPAAVKFGRDTGGRERSRRDLGLPPG